MNNWKAIAAMAENRVIGKDGKLPWNLPEELAWFKETTLGHTIVMGRKTFESIGKRALPKRLNIVISRTLQIDDMPTGSVVLPGLEALKAYPTQGHVFIIGGSELYKAALPNCNELYLTHVKQVVEGDAIFPPFESLFDEGILIKDTPIFKIIRYTNKSCIRPEVL